MLITSNFTSLNIQSFQVFTFKEVENLKEKSKYKYAKWKQSLLDGWCLETTRLNSKSLVYYLAGAI